MHTGVREHRERVELSKVEDSGNHGGRALRLLHVVVGLGGRARSKSSVGVYTQKKESPWAGEQFVEDGGERCLTSCMIGHREEGICVRSVVTASEVGTNMPTCGYL
jgi:hypothetical protein